MPTCNEKRIGHSLHIKSNAWQAFSASLFLVLGVAYVCCNNMAESCHQSQELGPTHGLNRLHVSTSRFGQKIFKESCLVNVGIVFSQTIDGHAASPCPMGKIAKQRIHGKSAGCEQRLDSLHPQSFCCETTSAWSWFSSFLCGQTPSKKNFSRRTDEVLKYIARYMSSI